MKKQKLLFRFVIIFTCLAIIFSTLPFSNEVYAAITEGNGGSITTNPSSDDTAAKIIGGIISTILTAGLGPLGSALSAVILVLVGIGYLLLWLIFYPITGDMPAVDTIVFNKISFFDPNFINPTQESIVQMMQGTIQKIYSTGYILAGSLFVIGAMIIGMKLAISSVASEKAYYKEMIVTWLKGLVLMFTIHIIVAGVFYLNEIVVSKLYAGFNVKEIEFKTEIFNNTPIGKTLNSIVGFIDEAIDGEPGEAAISGKGIGGLIGVLIYNSLMKGDVISAIAVATLLGQTVALIIEYARRMIVCIALGALAPYIVAVDFIRRLI